MRSLDTELYEDRKKKILQLVIHQYVNTAKPVGSKFIADIGGMDLSSATIRNVLSQLEEEGYITQPHTSAGRVPTDKGYRFYVDSLIEIQRLANEEERRITKEYERRTAELRGIMQQTSKILSSLSSYSGFVLAPRIEKDVLEHLEIVNLGSKRALAVIVSKSGMIRNKVILLKEDMPHNKLNRITQVLNKELHGVGLTKIKSEISKKISEAETEQKELISAAKMIAEEAFDLEVDDFFMEGAGNILSLPDMGDFKELKTLFNLVEEKKMLSHILEEELAGDGEPNSRNRISPYRKKGDIKIIIGQENLYPELKNMSLVSTVYQHNGCNIGVLGIIGPKRMEYSKMMALVDYISLIMDRMIQKE